MAESNDLINHPPHYTAHPSGIECITIAEYMNFNLGNAIKYIWRADAKKNPIGDLEKAKWYIERELARRDAMFQAEIREWFKEQNAADITVKQMQPDGSFKEV